LWVSRELQPSGSKAQRLSLGLFASRCIFWHDSGTLGTGGFGIDPAQKQAQFQTILIDAAQALQFQTDIAMQAFVRSVVLGMPGAASLQIDAQGHPPNREPAEPVHRTPTGKGTAIVTADGLRQSIGSLLFQGISS